MGLFAEGVWGVGAGERSSSLVLLCYACAEVHLTLYRHSRHTSRLARLRKTPKDHQRKDTLVLVSWFSLSITCWYFSLPLPRHLGVRDKEARGKSKEENSQGNVEKAQPARARKSSSSGSTGEKLDTGPKSKPSPVPIGLARDDPPSAASLRQRRVPHPDDDDEDHDDHDDKPPTTGSADRVEAPRRFLGRKRGGGFLQSKSAKRKRKPTPACVGTPDPPIDCSHSPTPTHLHRGSDLSRPTERKTVSTRRQPFGSRRQALRYGRRLIRTSPADDVSLASHRTWPGPSRLSTFMAV